MSSMIIMWRTAKPIEEWAGSKAYGIVVSKSHGTTKAPL